jgi:tetratricopeptide (TPR) repeat protein
MNGDVARRARWGRWAASALAASLGVAVPFVRLAEGHAPTVWERAQDPSLAKGDQIHREVQGLRYSAFFFRFNSAARQEQLVRAVRMLDEVDAEHASDVRLRFDLGSLLALVDQDKRAAAVLENAIAASPEHPSVADAYWSLAIAYLKLGRYDEEIAVYEEYLRRVTLVEQRTRALCNRAEGLVRRERMAEALRDYRESLILRPDDVLCHWGYAVALDRSGDAPAAMVEAKTAIATDPLDQQLSSQGVIFIPAYDRFWYEGLGAMSRAQQIDDPATSVLWWDAAVAKWAGYLAFAPADDRWVPLAKAHQVSCQRRVEKAKKAALRASKGRRRVVVEEKLTE